MFWYDFGELNDVVGQALWGLVFFNTAGYALAYWTLAKKKKL